MSGELKPCPWCGKCNVERNPPSYQSEPGVYTAEVWCADCGAVAPMGSGISHVAAVADAMREWNRRSPPVVDVAAVERAASALWAYDIREIEALNFDERFKARRMAMRAALLAAIGQPAAPVPGTPITDACIGTVVAATGPVKP